MTYHHIDPTLPRIVQYLEVRDSGEYGADNCAHCGAKGRYQHVFLCDDGKRHAAMAGCIQFFPVSPVAEEHKKIIERQDERDKKGQKLASWDVEKLDAIDRFYRGEIDESACLGTIEAQNSRRQAWLNKKYGRMARR